MNPRTARVATLAATGALGLALLPGLGTSASATSVPGALKVARAGDGTDLAVTWNQVAGVDHYDVTVFDGRVDRTTVVKAGTTSFLFDGTGACTRYRVRVAAVGTDGGIATTNDYLVNSLAPSGSPKVVAARTEAGTAGVLEWAPPVYQGESPVTAYGVKVTNLSNGKVVLNTVTSDTRVPLAGLDQVREYSAKVTPMNSYGACYTGTTVLYGSRPSQPTGFVIERDPATPSKIVLRWNAPAWAGFGPVTEFEVGYGDISIRHWKRFTGNQAAFTMNPEVGHVFAVRAISSNDIGILTAPVFVQRYGAHGTPVVDPRVTMTESDGTVVVDVTGPVGTSAAYPKMRISVDPTIKGAFHDVHVVANGASQAVFTQVPCGVYTVLVTGYGRGQDKEFGRKLINRCASGELGADLWKVVYGQAAVKGNSVAVTNGNETRVMSTSAHTGSDMVLTTTATLNAGSGYGIWARADVSAGGAAVTGYSMQYDPGYAWVSPSFGKAILLRLWTKGSECGTPLAKVPFPAGIDTFAPHRFGVVVKGDQMFATIDDKVVFDVPSLTAAVKANGCGMPVPTGTQIGIRTWGGTAATFTGTTLN